MIELKVDDQQIIKALEGMSAKLRNLRPAMTEISHDMLDAVCQRFDEGPSRWARLAKSTVKRYEKKGYSTSPTLNRTAGGLFPSISPDSSNDSATVGTNKKYAAIHHFGGTIKRPERQQVIHFRQQVRGKITRATRNEQGHLSGGDLFSKAKRGHYAMKVTVGGHTIKMPARPYMYLEEADRQRILATMQRHLEGSTQVL